MSNPVMRQFILKDLYAVRWTMIGALLTAVIALAIARTGSLGAYAAMIFLISAGAAPAVFVCMFLVIAERKEKTNLFCLSLPISGRQYALAKISAAAIAFLIPWALIAVLIAALITIFPVPTGFAPFGCMLWTFALDLFAMLVAITMVGESEGLTTAGIVFFNSSFGFYFFIFMRIPAIGQHSSDAHALWSPIVFQVIGAQLLIAAALIAFTLWRLTKRRDFI
jgi:ABC-2 type transport system permease protein